LPSSRIVSIGNSGGERAVGLERPTFVERAIAAITLTGVVAVLGRAAVDYFFLRENRSVTTQSSKPRGWYAGSGSLDAMRRLRHDEQADLPLLPVLRRLVDHGGHRGGARD